MASSAFSGKQAMHILTPGGAMKRRGYVAIHLHGPLPQLQSAMYGRIMVWLDEAPLAPFIEEPNGGALPSGPLPMHWTLLQGEGRSADDRYNSIYRLGLLEQDGTQLMANFETTPPVKTNCMQQSKRRLPVRRWACIEWHMPWPRTRCSSGSMAGRSPCEGARGRGRCLPGARPRRPVDGATTLRQPLHGLRTLRRYVERSDLWIDDVVLSKQRVGCPARK